MNGSRVRIDGFTCNDFSPQARLAAALKKKLDAQEAANLKKSGKVSAMGWGKYSYINQLDKDAESAKQKQQIADDFKSGYKAMTSDQKNAYKAQKSRESAAAFAKSAEGVKYAEKQAAIEKSLKGRKSNLKLASK